MIKAVIYARYSSHKQKEMSIESQIKECREFAEREGMSVIDEYIDRAKTGQDASKRMDLQRMLRDAKSRKFNAVIYWKQDRLGRNQGELHDIIRALKKEKVEIYSATESNGTGASAVLNIGIRAAVNDYYSADLSEKISRDMKGYAGEALYNGSYRTYGYNITEEKKFEINENEANCIRLIFNEYANGTSNKTILEKVNELGYKTVVGKEFTHDYISRMLRNEKYIGRYKWDEIVIDNAIPAIIDVETFEKVQVRMNQNKKTGARANADVVYALAGKLFCGHCGELMVADCAKKKKPTSSKASSYTPKFSVGSLNSIVETVQEAEVQAEEEKDYVIYRWYCCNTIKHPKKYIDNPKNCTKRRISKELIEQKVVEFAATQYLTDENIERLIRATCKIQKYNPTKEQMREIEKQIVSESAKIEKLIDEILTYGHSDYIRTRISQYEQNVNDLKATHNRLKNQLAPKYEEVEMKLRLLEIRDKMQSFIKEGKIPDAVVKQFVDIFISAVYVYDGDGDPDDKNCRPRVKIIFDEFETEGLSGFNEADIELSSTIDITGSPE